MTPPRILISAGMIQGGKSGVGRYVIELVKQLYHLGEHFELFVCGLDEDRERFPSIDDTHWITIPSRCSGGLLNLLWHQWRLPRHCRRYSIALLHIPSYRRILWRCPSIQVATIHDCAPFVMPNKYGLLRGIMGRYLVPSLARRCAQIIAVSHTTGRDIEHYLGVDPHKISVILNGIDHEHYHPPREEQLQFFLEHHDQQPPYLFYLARLEHPGKNHLRLIEAFESVKEQLPQWPGQLLLAGADWQGAEHIHRRIAQSPHSSSIRTLGFVSEKELPLWYAGALAYVQPSLFEGFGLPVVEAMACGTIVATSNRASLSEVGGPHALYFDPENIPEMAQKLLLSIGMDSEEREHHRHEGLLWAQQYSWERAAHRCLALYERLLLPGTHTPIHFEESS